MKRMCLIVFFALSTLGSTGCVMFHCGAMVKQYVAPNVVPTFFPHFALYHAMIEESSWREKKSFEWDYIPAYFFVFGLIPAGSLFFDTVLFPVNLSVVAFSDTTYHPFSIEKVNDRAWRFTWCGVSYSAWHIHPLILTVKQGAITLQDETGEYPQSYRLTTTEAETTYGGRPWPVTPGKPQVLPLLLASSSMESSSPRIPLRDESGNPRRVLYFKAFTLNVSEDFVGEITFEGRTITYTERGEATFRLH